MSKERDDYLRIAVATLVRRTRVTHEQTQEGLAFTALISCEYLNRIENYKAMPSVEVLDRLARAMAIPRLSQFLANDELEVL